MSVHRDIEAGLLEAAARAPSITLTGPRQSGKTTLCRALFPRHEYVNLEAMDIREFAADDPRSFLAQFPGSAIIDEVQRAPSLLSYLQTVIDEKPAPGRWVLTGSENLAVAESVNQSLAGRTSVHHLLPLARSEVVRFPKHPATLEEAIFTGGYPRILNDELDPSEWLRSYVATYLERDVRSLSRVGDLSAFQRFLELCAGRTSQLLNLSRLASDCGVSQPTASAWLSVLEAGFIVFRLPPFHANLTKRLVKMPKLHFYDTGLACWLIGIREADQLRTHPLRGPLFETWVVSEIVKSRLNRGESRGLYFYRNREGAEVDLVIERPAGCTLVEAKSAGTANASLFDRALRVQGHLTGAGLACDVVVAYGGERRQRRQRGLLAPWDRLHEEAW